MNLGPWVSNGVKVHDLGLRRLAAEDLHHVAIDIDGKPVAMLAAPLPSGVPLRAELLKLHQLGALMPEAYAVSGERNG